MATNFCNSNNNGNANNNTSTYATSFVRPRFDATQMGLIESECSSEGSCILSFKGERKQLMQSDTSGIAVNVCSSESYPLFEKLLDLNILWDSFFKCKQGVDWKCSVQKYWSSLLYNINSLRKQLETGAYRQKNLYEFDIHERGKIRHIKSVHISDRVLQRALCDYVLLPELRKYFIYDNSASLKDRGVEFSRRRLKVHLSRYYRRYGNEGYVLRLDVEKYFDSIPHDLLLEQIKEKIKDNKVINLVSYLFRTFGGNKGLGIGSQLSQVCGVLYLTPVDNLCKKVYSLPFYGRFNDDIYILHRSKVVLRFVKEAICKLLRQLRLKVNQKKTELVAIKRGFVFLKVKMVLKATGKILCFIDKSMWLRERRKIKKLVGNISFNDIVEQYRSWRGTYKIYGTYSKLRRMDKYVERLGLEYTKTTD